MDTQRLGRTRQARLRVVERNHRLRMTADCDDGSAFFVAVAKDGTALGTPFLLTPAKIRALTKFRMPESMR